MKKYTAKTLEDCLSLATKELGIPENELMYEVTEEKRTLFTKKTVITVHEVVDVVDYAESYLTDICHALGFDVSLKSFVKDDLIKILVETNHNSILIGKNGSTLSSLNDLTKLAVSAKFKKRFRILLDIGDYKDKKYGRVIFAAKKAAKDVLKNHIEIKLEPMTPDERKKVHNALTGWKNISTESIGDGKDRAITIKYVNSTQNFKSKSKEENIVESESIDSTTTL